MLHQGYVPVGQLALAPNGTQRNELDLIKMEEANWKMRGL